MPDLIGTTTAAGWTVTEKVKFPVDHTGGHFSECFLVERGNDKAFLKVIDITKLSDVAELLAGLSAFSYETSLATHTTNLKLSRVISLLESGQLEVDPNNPVAVLRKLPYLVFERGVGDIRSTVDVSKLVSNRWRFCVLHRAAMGLMQLHGSGIAHQDLKPSNIIQMVADDLKVGDLGRSSMRGQAAPHDVLSVAGALSYAPFELTYGYLLPDWMERRIATDVFHIGCLAVFVFTNVVLPGYVFSRLDPIYHPDQWGDPYGGVIPHLTASLQTSVQEISQDFPQEFRAELVSLVLDLCNPDPLKRGHRQGTGALAGTKLWLQKFVSRFDLLEKRAAVLDRTKNA